MTTAAHKAEWLRNHLKQSETYAGIILGQNGQPDHHLVLIKGEAEKLTWKEALAWAKKAGGALPTRRELRLLWVNAKDQFKPDWYWSGEQHAADSDYAWCQDFFNGDQGSVTASNRLRARAVRQIAIE
jgi:hypothetical protein